MKPVVFLQVKLDPDLKLAAQARCKELGITLSGVVRQAIEELVAGGTQERLDQARDDHNQEVNAA